MENVFDKYLKEKGYLAFDLKAVLFDMDGVLYNSMKYHAQAWYETMEEFGLNSTYEEFYIHEGRTGGNTIDLVMQRELGRHATEEEKETIYKRKSDLFNQYNKGEIIPDADKVVAKVKASGLRPVLVTGSGQKLLVKNLEINYPGAFRSDMMVTAYDVKNGKPHPEPYLMGLKKAGGLKPYQAIVIENAPMGVQSAVAAGLFTIAINTGPIPDSTLWHSGANIVLPSMKALLDNWDEYCKRWGIR